MWKETKTIITKGATINELWDAHSDVANWAKWQTEIEWTKVDEVIKKGTKFTIKPKSGPKVKLEVIHFEKPSQFTDVSYLPLCKMHTTTLMKTLDGGVEITLEIEMKGVLTFLWKNLIAKGILNGHQGQNEAMAQYIREKK